MDLLKTYASATAGAGWRVAPQIAGALACCIAAMFGCSSNLESNETRGDVGLVTAAVVQPNIRFGTRCQADYQNNWQATWNNNAACSGFNNKFDDSNTLQFYYNLVGAQWNFVDNSDSGWAGPDDVDLMLFSAHGGTSATEWSHPFWDQNSWWTSPQARLGDDGRQASVFASYACNTMNKDTTARMAPMLRGGLRIANGAYGLVWNGSSSWGNNFATRIQNGQAVGGSWLDAVYNSDNRNKPITWATGTNSSECWTRIGSNMSTTMSLARRRDGQIGYYCYVWI